MLLTLQQRQGCHTWVQVQALDVRVSRGCGRVRQFTAPFLFKLIAAHVHTVCARCAVLVLTWSVHMQPVETARNLPEGVAVCAGSSAGTGHNP